MLHSDFPETTQFSVNISLKKSLFIYNFLCIFPFEKTLSHRCAYLIRFFSYTHLSKLHCSLYRKHGHLSWSMSITVLMYGYNSTRKNHKIKCKSYIFAYIWLFWFTINLRCMLITRKFSALRFKKAKYDSFSEVQHSFLQKNGSRIQGDQKRLKVEFIERKQVNVVQFIFFVGQCY